MSTPPYSLDTPPHTFRDTVETLSPLQWLVGACMALVAVTSGTLWAYQANTRTLMDLPRSGGIHTEGIVGTPRFINPLLAVSGADHDLTSVVYAGLMKRNAANELVPELAESYTLSEDGTVYTFRLKPWLTFHDGTPLTAADVVFTVQAAARAAIRSPLFVHWEGVTVAAPDEHTVTFTLPAAYAPFIENTTLGILPKHIWEGLSDDEFAFSQFNTEPVGAGPYRVTTVVVDASGMPERYELTAFDHYVLGEPHITDLHFRLYRDKAGVLAAFTDDEVDALYGIAPKDVTELLASSTIPHLHTHHASQLRVFGVFFNHNRQPLFMRKAVREALDTAIPKQTIIDEVLGGYGTALNAPVPFVVVSKDDTSDAKAEVATTADASTTDVVASGIEHARAILEDAGWKRSAESGVYELADGKETIRLAFELSTSDAPELAQTAERIASIWREMGAEVQVKVYNTTDLTQSVIRPRRHEALLFGMDVGHEQDLYAFWHSSQRNDPGLNVGQFADIEADAALLTLRTTSDPAKRAEALQTFLDRIERERAGIFLYAPDFMYLTRDKLDSATMHPIATPSERFDTIHEWYLETDKVWPFVKRWLD